MPYTAEEEQLLNPFPWNQTMRETDPIHYYKQYDMWHVFRYNDVQRVLSDYAAFSSSFGGNNGDPLSSSLIALDPPQHRQLRNTVTQAFTPRSVTRLAERIATIVTGLLDRVAAQGHMDIIDDLAYPLPITVIAEMLGIPLEDSERFKAWSDELVGSAVSTEGRNPQNEMGAYFFHMIEQRRRDPQDDLISALLDAQMDGTHLNSQQLLGFCILLLVAGNETTTNLIGNALLCFDEHPEVMDQLRAEPALIPTAIEEVLRYRSPVKMMRRRAIGEVTLGDKTFHDGQVILAQINSANRDEAQFPHADVFDIRRTPNRHIAFGHGVHFCIGAPLARLEAKITLELLLARFHNIRRVHDVPLEPAHGEVVYGVKHLPITFRNVS